MASLGSFAMTFTFHLVFGLKEPKIAFLLSSICPLIIAPPLVYWAFSNNDRIAALNLELAVANAELAEAKRSLEILVRTDGLTGLLNRAAFFEALNPACATMGGTLLMLDVDHFKDINDHYGHAAGDDVLVLIGRLLSEGHSPQSFAGRLGGEEFGLFLPAVGICQAMPLAEALQRQVAADVGGRAGIDQAVTISIGAAEVEKGGTGASIYRLADAALYRAKRSGRNRVEAMDPTVS